MILATAGSLYGAATRCRRQWYARDRSRRRRLVRPVVSIGNLRAGGAGKTPIVAAVAQQLLARGERPAILVRGYARRVAPDGVTVVSDGMRVLARLDTAGDEALMLARDLPGVSVLVGADRYLSGCLAERRFGATLHLLDDGFQHLALARDVDLLVVDEEDLSERLLPAGRLREPLAAAAAADALLTATADPAAIQRLKEQLGVATLFRVSRALGVPRLLQRPDGGLTPVSDPRLTPACTVFAAAGIARPQRFFDDLTAAGWRLAGTTVFPDHHPFSAADVDRIRRSARAAGAEAVLTTEKDGVRMERYATADVPIAVVPLHVRIESDFFGWLNDHVNGAAGVRPRDVLG